jgi:benzoyl-CoA reductase/2-hydroxyglutaryl-CoA dehydratase subunit BcrC/BadD/HgdB
MKRMIGFACAYTPLPLIDAAGFVPFRILPVTSALDQAGSVLHDNMCPHVKRVLDRALSRDLPELSGVVFMNSCESMRRLADAWKRVRSSDNPIVVDLPSTADPSSIAYLANQLSDLWERLIERSETRAPREALGASVRRYNVLAGRLAALEKTVASTNPAGGRALLQGMFNFSVTRPLEESLAKAEKLESMLAGQEKSFAATPVYLFGNVLPGEEAFDLLENSGCRIVADSLCTGSRQLVSLDCDGGMDPFVPLARSLLARPPCARAVTAQEPHRLAALTVEEARKCGARGVIAHVMKFCDPYLTRLPTVREALAEARLPLLVLEGDCSLRSLGQSRTRIEAFVEMLGGKNP